MFLMPEQQLSRCDRVMRQRLGPDIHQVLSPCTLRAFDIPGEPEPAMAFMGKVRDGRIDFLPFEVPGEWGTTWGTTWFQIDGRIDLDAARGHKVELVVDLGWMPGRGPGFQSEGMVYRLDGTAIKSANPRNSWIPLIDGQGGRTCDIDEDGRFTLYLEAAGNPVVEGPTPFSPTDMGECATGKADAPYTLKRVDVCILNRGAYEYYMDLDTVSSLIRELHDDDPRYWQLSKALQRSLNAYDERDLTTMSGAREQLAGVLSERAASSVIDHVAVGHAHIDSAWLWPVRETHRKVARTVSNVLALMDEDPDFIYAMSSAQQYAWLEEEHPDLFARVRERVGEGRFIPVGGMWVESDGMLPSGESLVRQITFGKRYFREHLGVDAKGIWLPDSFGYSGSWPQIARRAGFEWFLTQKISWNDATKFPHHSFIWKGIDGTGILTHFPPSDTYGAQMDMHEIEYSQRNFLDKDLSKHAIILYGYGDGGGGPTREMNSRIRRVHSLDGAPRVNFGTPDELFGKVRTDIVDNARGETPVYQGELYLELHRATLTSQQAMKRGCREEESMLRVTEYLCAAASLKNPDYVYPREEMDSIWKTLLLNQFHDVLPGSAIAWVHRQAREEYVRDLDYLREMAHDACRAIDATHAISLPEAQILSSTRNDEHAWTVQSLQSHSGVRATSITHEHDATVLDNGLIRVVIEADGTVSSLRDIATGRELVPSGTRLGRYELLKDEPYQWDAWDIQRDAFLTATGIDDSAVRNSSARDDGSAVVSSMASAPGVGIETQIILRPDAKTLDFEVSVDWHVQERFLKVDLPVAVQARTGQYECQYGMVERPIQKNDIADEAKYESCTHRFVRVADASYAVAVVNASTYGSDATPLHEDPAEGTTRGTMIRLSLLSAPLYPDPHTDQGMHHFAWSLVPDAQMNAVLAEAARINAPVLQDVPDVAPVATIQAKMGVIVLDWVKLADDGSGDVVLRLYEAAGGSAQGVLHVCDELGDALMEEVNLFEERLLNPDLPRAVSNAGPQRGEGARITLKPFQLATLRVTR